MFFNLKGDMYCTPRALIVYLENSPRSICSSITSTNSMPRNIEFLGSTIDNSSSRFRLIYPVPDPDTAFLTPKAKKTVWC